MAVARTKRIADRPGPAEAEPLSPLPTPLPSPLSLPQPPGPQAAPPLTTMNSGSTVSVAAVLSTLPAVLATTTRTSLPSSASVTAGSVNVAALPPALVQVVPPLLLVCQRYVGAVPVAVTANDALLPSITAAFCGCAVIATGTMRASTVSTAGLLLRKPTLLDTRTRSCCPFCDRLAVKA